MTSSSGSPDTFFREGIQYTTGVGNNDIIMGRGLSAYKHPGNVYFRDLIQSKRSKYASTCRRQLKQEICDEVWSILTDRNCRFVREVKATTTISSTSSSSKNSSQELWIVADKHTIIQKIKQALRELDQKTKYCMTSEMDTMRIHSQNSPKATAQSVISSAQLSHDQSNQSETTHRLSTPLSPKTIPSTDIVSSNLTAHGLDLNSILQKHLSDTFKNDVMTSYPLRNSNNSLFVPQSVADLNTRCTHHLTTTVQRQQYLDSMQVTNPPEQLGPNSMVCNHQIRPFESRDWFSFDNGLTGVVRNLTSQAELFRVLEQILLKENPNLNQPPLQIGLNLPSTAGIMPQLLDTNLSNQILSRPMNDARFVGERNIAGPNQLNLSPDIGRIAQYYLSHLLKLNTNSTSPSHPFEDKK